MRDVAQWEGDFIEYQQAREDAEAKVYPQQYLDMLTASTTVVEGKGDAAAATGDAAAGDAAAAAQAASAPGGSGGGGGDPLTAFYDGAASSAAAVSEDEAQAQQRGLAGLAIAPRTTPADDIGDVRSLDRAYTQRLALLVRDARSGEWGLPEGARLPGEPMVQAAQRCLREAWGDDPALDLWYVGRAPVGHVLRVHTPEVQAATGTYGAKVFVYRAELIAGRFRLPPAVPGGAAGARFSDFAWLSRDEAEGVLARPLWKYLHQVMAGGAGEELAREEAWLARIEARGLTIAQATGRRAHRVAGMRLAHSRGAAARLAAGFRMPAVATREQAAIASMPWSDEGRAAKAAALVAAGDAYYARRADQRKRSAELAKTLATPTAAVVAAQRRQQKLKLQQLETPATTQAAV